MDPKANDYSLVCILNPQSFFHSLFYDDPVQEKICMQKPHSEMKQSKTCFHMELSGPLLNLNAAFYKAE